jgi:citrate lyase subunit beta / citryl-CoA lyase
MDGHRARRSSLSVPGSSERMLEKALGLEADEIVIDLEDSVAPEAKDQARTQVAAFLARPRSITAALAVRINPLTGPWGERDVVELVRLAGGRIDSLVVPKVERAQDIVDVQDLLESEGDRVAGVRLQALIETATGLLHVGEVAAASPRLESLILGYADLAASLGRAPGTTTPESWSYAQETVLVAARAAGLQAIDGPYLEIRDQAGLRRRAEHVQALGFDGKWAVHPDQLPIINKTFTPTAEQIARANAVLDALASAGGHGATALHGEMIDEASRKLALQVVARARAARPEGALQ